EVRLSAAWAVGGEEDPAVGAVDRGDVVEAGRLVRDLGDDRGLALAEVRDLVDLPAEGLDLELLRRRADDHAEERLRPRPVHGGLADGDRARALEAGVPEAGGAGDVLQRAARIEDEEIAAARRDRLIGVVVAERRGD